MSFEGSFDVVIEGLGTERGAAVITAPEGLYINKRQIPYSTLLGVALRGSILLVVGTQVAMALRGSQEGLATLAAELRGRADLEHLALSDRESLEGERVVFATPVAISGLIDMERFKGLALAAVTDAALHVFERGGRHSRVPWDLMNTLEVKRAQFGRLLRVASGATQLEFLYLTDAQIQTIRGLAARHSSGVLGVEAVERELSAVQPAGLDDLLRRFEVPEFEASLGGIGIGSDRPLGVTIERLQTSPLLPVGFLEEHLRELRNLYDGVLLKGKREAAASDDVFAASDALEGRQLWAELVKAVGVVSDATLRAFERQMRRLAANRRIPWRKARGKYMLTSREVAGLRQRLNRSVSDVEVSLDSVSEASLRLRPAADRGRAQLQRAYDGWQESLRALDQAYAAGWANLSRDIVSYWQEVFLPKLGRVGGERRRLLPRAVRVTLYFLAGLVVLILLYLALTGQLGEVIQFEQ